jgi:hypothetical protein
MLPLSTCGRYLSGFFGGLINFAASASIFGRSGQGWVNLQTLISSPAVSY